MGSVVSAAVAGLATAPIAAAHFNILPHYGILANVIVVPIRGFVVMPSAILAAVLAPSGGEALGLWGMAIGLGRNFRRGAPCRRSAIFDQPYQTPTAKGLGDIGGFSVVWGFLAGSSAAFGKYSCRPGFGLMGPFPATGCIDQR